MIAGLDSIQVPKTYVTPICRSAQGLDEYPLVIVRRGGNPIQNLNEIFGIQRHNVDAGFNGVLQEGDRRPGYGIANALHIRWSRRGGQDGVRLYMPGWPSDPSGDSHSRNNQDCLESDEQWFSETMRQRRQPGPVFVEFSVGGFCYECLV